MGATALGPWHAVLSMHHPLKKSVFPCSTLPDSPNPLYRTEPRKSCFHIQRASGFFVLVASLKHGQCVVKCSNAPAMLPDTRPKLFCFGLGYAGEAIARTLKDSGWEVAGTCRTQVTQQNLLSCDIDAHVFNPSVDGHGLRHSGKLAIHEATHILSTVPPCLSPSHDQVLTWHSGDIQLASKCNLRWIGYLSTSSVYGDWQGDMVDESSPAKAMDAKAKARVEAEEAWLQLGEALNVPSHVFRLGGIYGPGRSILDTLRNSQTLSASQRRRESQRYTARCHLADVCQVICASIAQPQSRGIFNVVDDDPTPRSDVLVFARALLGLSELAPRAVETPGREGEAGGASRGEKRVCNRRIKEELKVQLKYPDYKAGLAALASAYKGIDR